jgi:hypothetical protein
MDGWMNGWVDEWMNRWMDGWMGGWMNDWMDDWMDGDLSFKCFCFSQSNLSIVLDWCPNVQMPVSWTASSVRPYYMHRQFNGHAAATNKQTNKRLHLGG